MLHLEKHEAVEDKDMLQAQLESLHHSPTKSEEELKIEISSKDFELSSLLKHIEDLESGQIIPNSVYNKCINDFYKS